MFLVLLSYIKPLDQVDLHIPDHVAFLDKYYAVKKFVFSGRRNPRVGGVILVNVETEEEVQRIIQEDPFYIHQIAEYSIIQFVPTKYDQRFASFLSVKGNSIFPILQTERFTLRKIDEQDAPDILEIFSNEDVVKYLPLGRFATLQDALDEIHWYTRIFDNGTGIRWGIEERESKRIIGTCGFLNYDQQHNRAEIGFDLSRQHWGMGIMTDVAKVIIAYGFGKMNLNRIEAKVDPENAASGNVLAKLGFQQEGVLRRYEHEKGKYIDIAVYALLNGEA